MLREQQRRARVNAALFEAECDAAFREIIWLQLTRNLEHHVTAANVHAKVRARMHN